MASNDKLKIMLSFMREVNDGNMPQAADYEITNGELWDIIDACQDEGYIKGARFAHDSACGEQLQSLRIGAAQHRQIASL